MQCRNRFHTNMHAHHDAANVSSWPSLDMHADALLAWWHAAKLASCAQGPHGVQASRGANQKPPSVAHSNEMTSTPPTASRSPREVRLMTLDSAAGSVPSHLRRDGVKGMLCLFESRADAATSTSSSSSATSKRSGESTKSSKRIGVGEDSARRLPTSAAAAPTTPSNNAAQAHTPLLDQQGADGSSGDTNHSSGGTAEFDLDMEDMMAKSDTRLPFTEQRHLADATFHACARPFDARGRWASATRLSALVARACLPRRRRGASVGCLRVLRNMVTAVAGRNVMTTEEACVKIIKPMCTAAGGTFGDFTNRPNCFHHVIIVYHAQ